MPHKRHYHRPLRAFVAPRLFELRRSVAIYRTIHPPLIDAQWLSPFPPFSCSVCSIDEACLGGCTIGMRTTVSIPDEVFAEAERLARHLKQSRSEVYSLALAEYVARHAPDRVTEAMDRVAAEVGTESDAFVAAAAARMLKRSPW